MQDGKKVSRMLKFMEFNSVEIVIIIIIIIGSTTNITTSKQQ